MDRLHNRRPLKSRSTSWAQALAGFLLRAGATPNAISVAGIGFAAAGAAAFLMASDNSWLWLAGAAGIQLRLVANLLDGMVAVEGGRFSPVGALYNEFPDRIEDSVLLVAAGYAAEMSWLGWLAALLALGAAYVRALGGSLGLAQDFCGPMAKQHRMAALNVGAVVSAVLPNLPIMHDLPIMTVTLAVIAAGTAVTCVRRLLRQAQHLREAAQ